MLSDKYQKAYFCTDFFTVVVVLVFGHVGGLLSLEDALFATNS